MDDAVRAVVYRRSGCWNLAAYELRSFLRTNAIPLLLSQAANSAVFGARAAENALGSIYPSLSERPWRPQNQQLTNSGTTCIFPNSAADGPHLHTLLWDGSDGYREEVPSIRSFILREIQRLI